MMKLKFYNYLALIALVNGLLTYLKAPLFSLPIASIIIVSILALDFKYTILEKYIKESLNQYDPSMDLNTARRVQEALLEVDPPEAENIKIAKRCCPATNLGGDFYTFINKIVKTLTHDEKKPGILEYNKKSENVLGIAVGDVAGHGVSSALVMALSSGILGRVAQNNDSPATILEKANQDIQKFIEGSQISHLTAFYANINVDTLSLTYSNGGHPPALVLHADDSFEKITTDGIFLGMYDDEKYEEKTYQFQKKDRLFLFTDGIIEVANDKHEAFGTSRLKNIAVKHKEKSIDDLLDIIFNELNTFRGKGEQKDDETLIIVEIN